MSKTKRHPHGVVQTAKTASARTVPPTRSARDPNRAKRAFRSSGLVRAAGSPPAPGLVGRCPESARCTGHRRASRRRVSRSFCEKRQLSCGEKGTPASRRARATWTWRSPFRSRTRRCSGCYVSWECWDKHTLRIIMHLTFDVHLHCESNKYCVAETCS